jgi:hypothetical protein
MNVHAAENEKECYKCDYLKCDRSENPFTRKDHYRAHLRDYHKEDLGRAKASVRVKEMSSNKQLDLQKQWLDERSTNPNWWRCMRCLARIDVKASGWDCPSCGLPCESDRKERREKVREKVHERDVVAEDYESDVVGEIYEPCLVCNETLWVENLNKELVPCHMCSGSTLVTGDFPDEELGAE